jgi:hypothetical protein
MSDTLAAVRFKSDGLIVFTVYYGVGDNLDRKLHKNIFAAFEFDDLDWGEPKKPQPVEIFSTYGEGFHWEGTACRETMQMVDGISPPFNDGVVEEGVPGWAVRINEMYIYMTYELNKGKR